VDKANKAVAAENLQKATSAVAIAADAIGRLQGGPDSTHCVELDSIRYRLDRIRVKATGPTPMIEEGTVVEGTMRTEDLIRAFGHTLRECDYSGYQQVKSYYAPVLAYMRDHAGELYGAPASLLDSAEHMREELYDRLDEVAPEGMYFGAHPGDGADFGFWTIDEEV
jgi:hypothetical protein